MSRVLGKQFVGSQDASFVSSALIGVPFSTILNRAKIRDFAKDMRAAAPVERVHFGRIAQVQEEFGATGELVQAPINDVSGRVRFVGTWANSLSADGLEVSDTPFTTNYVEITFYGTGLNLLVVANGGARDYRATVDGGAEGGNLYNSSTMGALGARGYSANQTIAVVSNLSPGIHTVRIRQNTSTSVRLYGYEILNEDSAIRAVQGKVVSNGLEFSNAADTMVAFKPTGVGTRGARVILYNAGSGVQAAYRNTNSSAAYLSAADHTNEDILRTYNFREFGNNRTDDFSTIVTGGTSDRAYALEDGSTALHGDDVERNANGFGSRDGVFINASGGSLFLNFIGTGLDLFVSGISNGGWNGAAYTIYIDGVSQGNLADPALNGKLGKIKVASGLPYGSHTFRIVANSANGGRDYIVHHDFIVYGPKKPTVPAGALEIADYCVMADYVNDTAINVTGGISTGVLRKCMFREFSYAVGTFSIGGFQASDDYGLQIAQSGNASSYFEYTFTGTGFEIRPEGNTNRTDLTVTLNGTLLTTANFPTAVASVNTANGAAINLTTGVFDVSTSSASRQSYAVYNLPLRKYTVRFAAVNTNNINIMSFGVITPIHSHVSEMPVDQQNSLPVGSCSIRDLRPIAANQSSLKFRGVAQGLTSSPSTTSTVFIPCPDMSLSVPSKGGWFRIDGSLATGNSTSFNLHVQIYVDGVALASDRFATAQNTSILLTLAEIVYLSPGVHKIDMYWRCASANTQTANGVNRNLIVEEL